MEVSQEQIQKLKKEVLEQINSTFPEDKREQAIQKIESMGQEQFIEFLKQNNLLQNSTPEQIQGNDSTISQDSPFRQIIDGKIPSHKIDENEDCIAVLEINPISNGHTIIIPKNPVYEASGMPKTCLELAEKVSKTIGEKLKPKEVIVKPSSVLGEIIINVLPKYENETLESQRIQGKQEELEVFRELLEVKPETKIPEVKKEEISLDSETKIILPKRIP